MACLLYTSVSTEEALSAVPRGLREAALACGASKWQMIKRIILPSACLLYTSICV